MLRPSEAVGERELMAVMVAGSAIICVERAAPRRGQHRALDTLRISPGIPKALAGDDVGEDTPRAEQQGYQGRNNEEKWGGTH